MATVTKFADVHTAVATGWSTPENAFDDDADYATAAPAKNNTVSGRFGFPAFSSSDIPDSSTINSCTVEIVWKCSTTLSIATFGVQIHNPAGTALGTETTDATEPAADTVRTQQVTSGISLSDLRSANVVVAHCRATRGNDNDAYTGSLEYVKLTVDYTAPPPEVTLAGTISGASGVSAALALVVSLSAAVAGESSVSASMAAERSLAAVIAGQSGLAAALEVESPGGVVPLAAAISGTSSVSAALAAERALGGVVAGQSGLAASMTVDSGGGPTETGFVSISMFGGL